MLSKDRWIRPTRQDSLMLVIELEVPSSTSLYPPPRFG